MEPSGGAAHTLANPSAMAMTPSAQRILDRQQRLEARQELQRDPDLSELLDRRLGEYLPGDVASLARLVEVLATHPLAAERWRQLSRAGQRLVERDARGEARADEVDLFLGDCAELLVPTEQPAYRKATPVRIPAHQVDGLLYRSPQPGQNDLEEARGRGVRLVVNLREESTASEELCRKLGLDYHFLPVPDQSTPRLEQVREFLEVVQARGPALVHCWAGRGRTGLFVACYRVWRGVEAEEAIRLSDAEALSRGMRDVQRDFVRRQADSVRAIELRGP